MRRIQFFELVDQPWYPRLIRDAQTDFLAFLLRTGNQYADGHTLARTSAR